MNILEDETYIISFSAGRFVLSEEEPIDEVPELSQMEILESPWLSTSAPVASKGLLR